MEKKPQPKAKAAATTPEYHHHHHQVEILIYQPYPAFGTIIGLLIILVIAVALLVVTYIRYDYGSCA